MNEKNEKCWGNGNPANCTGITEDNQKTFYDNTNIVKISQFDNPQGWPNLANNAGCTKGTYTAWYYGSNAAVVTVAAATVAALSIVF